MAIKTCLVFLVWVWWLLVFFLAGVGVVFIGAFWGFLGSKGIFLSFFLYRINVGCNERHDYCFVNMHLDKWVSVQCSC